MAFGGVLYAARPLVSACISPKVENFEYQARQALALWIWRQSSSVPAQCVLTLLQRNLHLRSQSRSHAPSHKQWSCSPYGTTSATVVPLDYQHPPYQALYGHPTGLQSCNSTVTLSLVLWAPFSRLSHITAPQEIDCEGRAEHAHMLHHLVGFMESLSI